jgi:addiction module RelE/StbE family toxin
MIKVVWDQGFKKSYKKKVKNNSDLKERFWHALDLFSNNPFDPSIKTHKLTGKLKGYWAFSIDYDCRVVFKFLDKNEAFLIEIGGHDEVY